MHFNRIALTVDKILGNDQVGFRKGRDCNNQTLIIRNLMQQAMQRNKNKIKFTYNRFLTGFRQHFTQDGGKYHETLWYTTEFCVFCY